MKEAKETAEKIKRVFDESQLQAITVTQNAVVSAGAGSGKTTVLSERFSYLVTEKKYSVDQILTLTFTKKATVEMSARIYKVLKKKAPEQAAIFFKANIKTLDSYCSSVAKIGAHLYGISPDFTQNDEVLSKQIQDMALPFILEHRDNPAIKMLVSTDDFDSIAEQLFVKPILENSTVSTPINFGECIKKQHEEIIRAWKEKSIFADKAVSALLNAFNQFEGNTDTQSYKNLTAALSDPETFPEIPPLSTADIQASNYKKIAHYAAFIQKIAAMQKPRGNGYDEIKEIIDEIRAVSSTLLSIVNYVSGFAVTKALIPLLEEFQRKVNNTKRASAVLTFKDVSDLALCILRDHPELRKIEKAKYKAIMIDEFQDNNAVQRDMLFLLAEKPERMEKGVPSVSELCADKLFFVGDEKQSIYKFRGADVSVFRALSNDFSDGNRTMSTNYRSHQSLIAAFNTIFGGIPFPPPRKNTDEREKPSAALPSVFYTENSQPSSAHESEYEVFRTNPQTEEKSVPDYEAVYHEVTLSADAQKEADKPESANELYKPRICLALYDKNQKTSDGFLTGEEAEAQWVAKKIRLLITKGADGMPPVEPKDIAILQKSYALQPLYERTLLNMGIPYNTETVTGFFSDGPTNDIFALLRLCVYEEDTLSYMQVLRSPWVNLSAVEANAVLCAEEKPFSKNEAVRRILEPCAWERYCRAADFLSELRAFSRDNPLTGTVTKLWYESGYCYETMWNQTVSMYSKMYDLIFELARQSEQKNMSLASFVDSMRTYQDQTEKLDGMDIPLEQTNGVHILTIHKSKGLEYPVVFVCATHKRSMSDRNVEAVYTSKEYGITINTPSCAEFPNAAKNYFYQKVTDLNRKQASAELRRLVYVALTRAKNQLYITNGNYERKADAEKYLPGGETNPSTIFHVLEPVINYYLDDDSCREKPFTVEQIISAKRFSSGSNKTPQNSRKGKIQFIKELKSQGVYENAECIEKDAVPKRYIAPSQLQSADDETYQPGTAHFQNSEESVPYPEINRIIEESVPSGGKYAAAGESSTAVLEPRFSYSDFGTVAHTYLEAAVTKTKPIVPNAAIAGIADNKTALETIRAVCAEMAQKFQNSPLGKAAAASEWHKAEYPFKSRIGEKIIRGTIDLIFKNTDGTYTIVDYKTNRTIQPEIYFTQLACYRKAAAQMLLQPENSVRCVLYYLRYHTAIDITDECKKIDLNRQILSDELKIMQSENQ